MSELQEKLCLSAQEAAKLLGVGRSTLYAAIKRGEIPHLKVGGRLLVPKAALKRLIDGGK